MTYRSAAQAAMDRYHESSRAMIMARQQWIDKVDTTFIYRLPVTWRRGQRNYSGHVDSIPGYNPGVVCVKNAATGARINIDALAITGINLADDASLIARLCHDEENLYIGQRHGQQIAIGPLPDMALRYMALVVPMRLAGRATIPPRYWLEYVAPDEGVNNGGI